MKAIAIDTSIGKITVGAQNEDKIISETINIGMKQSETLLPSLAKIMEEVSLKSEDVDYLSIAKGPGSFTGLRLGYACIKAFQIKKDIPLYAFSTLDVYAWAYRNIPLPLVSCIDAHKERFYLKAFDEKNNEVISEGDYEEKEFYGLIKNAFGNKKILIAGPDSKTLKEKLLENDEAKSFNEEDLIPLDFTGNPSDALLSLLEEAVKNKKEPTNDYDGPEYLRASDAESLLTSKA